MKILVVDDSSTMRKIIMRVLSHLGYGDIAEAEHGLAGLRRVGRGDIDLIITDWNMPVMNGLEMVIQVRNVGYVNLPVLMVTTNGTDLDIVQAIQAGVDNFVTKPMTVETLGQKIRETLRARKVQPKQMPA